jgi:hypothetical protein
MIGQAPGRTPGPVLGGRAGRRLAELAGIDDLSEFFELRNLLDRFPGKAGKGDAFPIVEARAAALRLMPELNERRVILLGRNVASAFPHESVRTAPYLFWIRTGDEWSTTTWLVLPHPSGVNLWWNDPRHVADASALLRRLVDEARRRTRVECPAAAGESEIVPLCPLCQTSLERHTGWDGRPRVLLTPPA